MNDSGVSKEARNLAESGLVLGKPVSAGPVTVIPVIRAWVTVADLLGVGGVHYASARVHPAAVVIVNGDKVDVVGLGNESEPARLSLENIASIATSVTEFVDRARSGSSVPQGGDPEKDTSKET